MEGGGPVIHSQIHAMDVDEKRVKAHSVSSQHAGMSNCLYIEWLCRDCTWPQVGWMSLAEQVLLIASSSDELSIVTLIVRSPLRQLKRDWGVNNCVDTPTTGVSRFLLLHYSQLCVPCLYRCTTIRLRSFRLRSFHLCSFRQRSFRLQIFLRICVATGKYTEAS